MSELLAMQGLWLWVLGWLVFGSVGAVGYQLFLKRYCPESPQYEADVSGLTTAFLFVTGLFGFAVALSLWLFCRD